MSGCISVNCRSGSRTALRRLRKVTAIRVHRGDSGEEYTERPGGREGDGVDQAAMHELPHVDAAAEGRLRQRRLDEVSARGVVHAHVVDAVPDDEREHEPEDQETFL